MDATSPGVGPGTLDALAAEGIHRRFRETGVALVTGPFVSEVRATVPRFVDDFCLLYADYPVHEKADFADFHVSVEPIRGPRGWFRSLAVVRLDDRSPFPPLSADQALPMFEWGLNWAIVNTAYQYLIIHAAAIERNGRAAILPAPPGSGKSTLCAGLVHRGWRLLSDEQALVSLDEPAITALARPVSLKNESIDVIRTFAEEAVIGCEVSETNKGTVALMKAPRDSVLRKSEPARPAWVIFPRYAAGSAAQLTPRSKADTFLHIGNNAFNYSIHGTRGFDALARVIDGCDCYDFAYGDLDEAVEVFAALADAS